MLGCEVIRTKLKPYTLGKVVALKVVFIDMQNECTQARSQEILLGVLLKEIWNFLLQSTSPGAVKKLIWCVHIAHIHAGLVNIHTYIHTYNIHICIYIYILQSALYLHVLAKPIIHCCLCRLFSIA